jgi:predicted CoA-binding protein
MGCLKTFFKLPLFAVVGASNNREKFGNKVLRCYQQYSRHVVPISKVSDNVEGVDSLNSLTRLAEKLQEAQAALADSNIHAKYKNVRVADVGVSIITPPAVTRAVLEEGLTLGYRNFFLQPGTVDEDV